MIDVNAMSHGWLLGLALLNFVLCSAIGWSALCRLRCMSKATTLWSWRLRYSVLMFVASASGLSPWLFREWPGPGQIAMAIGALYVVGLTARGWKQGPPVYARKPEALCEAEHVHVAGGRQ